MLITFVLTVAIILYGAYYETFAAFISVVIAVLLICKTVKGKKMFLPKSVFLWGIMLLPIAALISVPFSVDRGMAFLGFVKMFPTSLFCIMLSYSTKEEQEKALQFIPLVTVCATILGLLSRFTSVKELFYIQERFSGIFQYANSYAMLLLISIVIVLYSGRKAWFRIILSMFFLYAIWETGSRSVGVLAIICLLVWILSLEGRKKLFAFIIPTTVIILFAVGISIGNRWGDFNLLSSSFVSRLFYNYDGFMTALSKPFGLGYKGFLFYQGAVQTANYSTIYVHNELLQTVLDFGWVPAIMLLIGTIAALFRKGISLRNRSLLMVIFVHSMFDWDLQFTALLFILVLIVVQDINGIIEFRISKLASGFVVAMGSCIIAVCVWLGTATFFEYTGNYQIASKLYPGFTTSQMKLINEADALERVVLAENICSRNDYCIIALQALAENAINEGKIADAEKYAFMAMKAGKYNSDGYEFYIRIMDYALDILAQIGDEEGMYAVLAHIAEVPVQIERVEESTSPCAKYLFNKPDIKLDDEYIIYLKEVENLMKREENYE